MTPTIWYSPTLPPEIKTVLEPILRAYLHILPTWMHELIVRYDAADQNAATMNIDQEYRRATLTVTGQWLLQFPGDREENIRHELSHILVGPLTEWTKDLIDRLAKDDERLSEWLKKEWQLILEGVTTDVQMALFRARKP